VPVVKTAAISGIGVAELWKLIATRGAARKTDGLAARRRRRARYLIARAAADLVAQRIRRGDQSIDDLADAVLEGRLTAADAAVRAIGSSCSPHA
jgi:LAO/AO transport system kinase